MTIVPDRLTIIERLRLGAGAHSPADVPSDGELCVMEAVAWVAGEPWSDSPQCASSTIMAADWLIRVHTPAWLRLAGLDAVAGTVANLPEVDTWDKLGTVTGTVRAARVEADAAWAAARDADGAAAWDAARAAARDALQPTRTSLQDSALQLLERMLAVTEEAPAP